MHDGILVGIGTVLNDDPQLNVRHLPAQDEPYPLPRPIVLDTDLRLSTSCKLLKNYQQRLGRRPWVVCNDVFSPEKSLRKQALEEAGAKIIQVIQGPDRLSINSLLTTLHKLGIKSLMVEGGQRVISSFLSHQDAESERVVDVLIVTVAPTFVGAKGVGVLIQGFNSVPRLEPVRSTQFGHDTVMVCHID
ncbi:dihydrofolate reductase-like domain-containing protein [Gautieria morchelliformis]|nr:dihydrofolate reductase-like domain-containing protein [Gautieria morchelliformis]